LATAKDATWHPVTSEENLRQTEDRREVKTCDFGDWAGGTWKIDYRAENFTYQTK
jgi:hypothetical protein